MNFWNSLYAQLNWEKILPFLYALLTLLAGLLIARIISSSLARGMSSYVKGAKATLIRRVIYYCLCFFVIMLALDQVGYDLKVLWGAAGIFTIAIGFASQTSASNFISGLFLIAEKPFDVGDSIQIGATTGEVLSIDMLSVKLRTWENLFVRIPNESMVKSEITNYSRFPIRRFDIRFGVAYGTDLARLKRILFELAEKNLQCLEEPKPIFRFSSFGDSGLLIEFLVWSTTEVFLTFRTDFLMEINTAMEEHGINIPFPQRTLSFLSPLELADKRGAASPADAAGTGSPDQTPATGA